MEDEKPNFTSVYLWNTKEVIQLLDGITLAAIDSQPITEPENSHNPGILPGSEIDLKDLQVSTQTTCSTCGAEFQNTKEQRDHFKSDWHRFNLKQRLKGSLPVSEDHFEDVAGDISSISGTGSSDDSTDSETEDKNKDLPQRMVSNRGEEDSDSGNEESYHIEGAGKRHPRVFYKNASNELLSIYRCVLHSKKNQPETSLELINLTKDMPHSLKWAIFMSAGGHFAGAIFNGEAVVVHKTFHRYIVRAKRGTAQSLRDKQGHAPKSGGASLRRYNEAALTQEIQELISTTWKEELKSCSRIFLRAPSFNKQMFFFGKTAPLDKKDSRIRMIPLQTRRPTFKELHRVHELLAEVVVYGKDSVLEDHITLSPKKPSAPQPRKRKTEIPQVITEGNDSSSSEEEVELQMSDMTIDTTELASFACTRKPRRKKKPQKKTPANTNDMVMKQQDLYDEQQVQLRNDLYTACKVGDEGRLNDCLREMDVKLGSQTSAEGTLGSQEGTNTEETITSPSIKPDGLLNTPFGDKFTTLLHVVAQGGHSKLISPLLLAGADPTNKDYQERFPYVVCADKETKNVFRRFMSKHPDMYNYSVAQIPGPLTAEMESEKKTKEAEKKKAQRKARKERQKEQNAVDAQQREEERERQRYLNLSDREKRALAAERRLLVQKSAASDKMPVLSRCWQCGNDITGKVPFEYYDYKFCTPKCLKDHKLASQKKS